MRIVRESVTANIDKAAPLLRAHWDEIALNKGVMVLEPNVEAYQALEDAGLLVGLFAYVGDELVGYAVSIFNPGHLHYRGLKSMLNDVLYVKPEHRNGRAGLGLIRETEKAAAEMGAKLVLWHAKPNTALEAILPRLGYGVQDVIFSKEVG